MEGCYNFVKILVQRWVQVLKESSLDFFTCFRQSNVTRHPGITPPFDSVTHTRAIIPEPCKKKRKTHFPQIFGFKNFLIKSFTFVLVQLSKLTKLILFSILKKSDSWLSSRAGIGNFKNHIMSLWQYYNMTSLIDLQILFSWHLVNKVFFSPLRH